MAGRQNNIDYERLRSLVRELLPAAGTPRSVSLAASNDRNPDLIRNLLEGTESAFPSVVGLCRELKINLASILRDAPVGEASPKEWLTVNGEVKAGTFHVQPEWPYDDWYQVEVDTLEGGDAHHGLIVKGRSMDKTLPPGTVLRCVELISGRADWQDGDYVIVEKKRGGLVELTCKRLFLGADGIWELRAESHLSEFRDPIVIGKPIETPEGPGFDMMTDDETRVKAVVIDAYLPLRRRKTRPMPDAH